MPNQPNSNNKRTYQDLLVDQEEPIVTLQFYNIDDQVFDCLPKLRRLNTEIDLLNAYFDSSNLGHQEETNFLEELLQEYQQEELPNCNIDGIDDYCWVNIYSFLGIEQIFLQKPFLINQKLHSIISRDGSKFWEAIFQQLWKGNQNRCFLNWMEKREYCFGKFLDFVKQENSGVSIIQRPKPHCIGVNRYIHNDISNTCHIIQVVSPYCHYLEFEQGNRAYHVDWVVSIYLTEKPIKVSLYIKANLQNLSGHFTSDFFTRVFTENDPIDIFATDTVTKVGIMRLFESLELDPETDLLSEELDLRFQSLRFGPLMNDKYFIWFCNSILSYIPFPIEDVFGCDDFSEDLDFGVDDERNNMLAKFYELKYELGIDK